MTQMHADCSWLIWPRRTTRLYLRNVRGWRNLVGSVFFEYWSIDEYTIPSYYKRSAFFYNVAQSQIICLFINYLFWVLCYFCFAWWPSLRMILGRGFPLIAFICNKVIKMVIQIENGSNCRTTFKCRFALLTFSTLLV